MPPWIAQVTFNTQTVLIVVGVIAGVVIVGCLLYILYDQPPDSEPRKPKAPTLPYAPPPPPGVTLGPRFAQIEAWKREQEGDRPFLPTVPRLGATPPASSAPPSAEATEAADPAEANWLNDQARPPTLVVASPGAPSASARQPQVVAPERQESEPHRAPESPPAREVEPATASDAADGEVPSLRPVQPGVLAELELAAPPAEEGEREPAEAAREDRPALHPVHLDWMKEDFREEPEGEQEEDLPAVASEGPHDVQPRVSPVPAEATPEADAVVLERNSANGSALLASEETPGVMPIALQAFGRAHLLVYGQPVESRANQRLELVLYLAHQAAQPGEKREFVDRLIISDELWPGMSRDVPRQLERLRNCKSDLLDDVGKAGLSLEQCQWLETGPENALRLHRAVPNDLARFDTLVEQIAEARAQAERGAPQMPLEHVEAWQTRLQQLYQSGFAQQFRSKPWLDKARRHYQARFFQARFDLARLLVCLGAERQAIELGTETVLAANPSGDGMMRLLVSWVQRQEPIEREAWASRFGDEYERRYGRTLARAHEKMETLRLSALPPR